MKKIFLFFSFILLINCSDSVFVNDCFPNISVSGTINLNLPQFINILTPGGESIASIDGRNIIIINRANTYLAYDLACPEGNCSSTMVFDGLTLNCPCTEKEYNILLAGGAPVDGEGCSALQYTVTQTGSSTLQISN